MMCAQTGRFLSKCAIAQLPGEIAGVVLDYMGRNIVVQVSGKRYLEIQDSEALDDNTFKATVHVREGRAQWEEDDWGTVADISLMHCLEQAADFILVHGAQKYLFTISGSVCTGAFIEKNSLWVNAYGNVWVPECVPRAAEIERFHYAGPVNGGGDVAGPKFAPIKKSLKPLWAPAKDSAFRQKTALQEHELSVAAKHNPFLLRYAEIWRLTKKIGKKAVAQFPGILHYLKNRFRNLDLSALCMVSAYNGGNPLLWISCNHPNYTSIAAIAIRHNVHAARFISALPPLLKQIITEERQKLGLSKFFITEALDVITL